MTHYARAWAGRAAPAAALVVFLAGCTGVAQQRQVPTPVGTAGMPSSAVDPSGAAERGPARQLRGRALTGPIALRLLVEGGWYNADTGTGEGTGITSWLRPVTGPPILLIEPEPEPAEHPGTVTVERVDAGSPTLRVGAAAERYRLAPSVDGRGVWVSEYRSRTRCVLRELGLDGRTRRAARQVPCGVEPLVETPAGLWVSRWVNVFTLAGRSVEFTEPTYALLDPRTLRAKASYEQAFVVGTHHVLTMDDRERQLMLRDLRTGSAVPLTKPAADLTFFVFNAEFPVARVSPDGRYAVFRLGSHARSPQVIDLWVLDLAGGAWQQVPGMPVHGALKYAREAWAPDGRLVMLGQFGVSEPVLATWRPGQAEVSVRPDPLPASLYEGGLGALLAGGASGTRPAARCCE